MMGHDQQEANVETQQLQQAINVTQMFDIPSSFQHPAYNQQAPAAAIEPDQQEARVAAQPSVAAASSACEGRYSQRFQVKHTGWYHLFHLSCIA